MDEEDRIKANFRQRMYMQRQRCPGDLSREDFKRLVALYNYRCVCCGKKFDHWYDATIDHIKPVADGGITELSNIQPVCKPCNLKKGNREIDYRPDIEQASFLVVENSHYSTGSLNIFEQKQ